MVLEGAKARRFQGVVAKTAELSKCRQRHAALITDGHKLIAIAHNEIRHHRLSNITKYKEALHAEVAALIRARGIGKVMFTCRINKKGELLDGRPCDNCIYVIHHYSKIEVIIYSIQGGWKTMHIRR